MSIFLGDLFGEILRKGKIKKRLGKDAKVQKINKEENKKNDMQFKRVFGISDQVRLQPAYTAT